MCRGLLDMKTLGVVCHLGNVGLKNDGSEKMTCLGIYARY